MHEWSVSGEAGVARCLSAVVPSRECGRTKVEATRPNVPTFGTGGRAYEKRTRSILPAFMMKEEPSN
jgi:hypothetical protein